MPVRTDNLSSKTFRMDNRPGGQVPWRGFLPGLLNFTSMFFAYVLKSELHDFYYKGHCHDLDKRLSQHNAGFTTSIRPYIPFRIVYFESFHSEKEAIAREKYFKSAAGRRYLKKVIVP